jgi:small ligand-binding sensory domain FIST
VSLFFASAASDSLEAEDAVSECLARLTGPLQGRRPDILFVFASPHHRDAYSFMLESLMDGLKPGRLMGCSGGGVIGGGRELEDLPGLSVTAAVLPGVKLDLLHLGDEDLPGPDAGPKAWEEALGQQAADKPQFILLASPFMGKAEDLLAGLDYAFPQSHKIGGIVSGLRHVNERVLFLDGQRFHDGAVLLSLRGALRIDSLVAQGCRPVGPVYTVTQCERNLIYQLDGATALKALQSIYDSADTRTRDLLQRALFVGLVAHKLSAAEPQAGDHLIRNVLGLDGQRGSIAVGAVLREGQRLQFHVRDAEAADEDLRKVLGRFKAEQPGLKVKGGLLFSCLGRGERLFGEADHDSQAFADAFDNRSLGGFFCNGEIGPVGASTYIHGFTSSFGIFSEP